MDGPPQDKKPRPRWAAVHEMIWEATLAPTEKLVLFAIQAHADVEGACWPGITRLAEMAGANERTVRRALEVLHELGIVLRSPRRRKDGGNTSALLKLDLVALEATRTRPAQVDPPPGQFVRGAPGQNVQAPPVKMSRPPRTNTTPGGGPSICLEPSHSEPSPAAHEVSRGTEAISHWRTRYSDAFVTRWEARFGARYAFDGPVDGRALGLIHRVIGDDLATFERLVDRYLADETGYVVGVGHTLAILAKRTRNYLRERGVKRGGRDLPAGTLAPQPGFKPAADGPRTW